MTPWGLLAVGLGAAFGAWLRWALGLWLNPLFATVPLGTLAANLVGGLLMGCALGGFQQFQALAPEWRLFVITGFLGGLTTFSTFSAEITTLLARGELAWALGGVLLHLLGSLAMTGLGLWGIGWLLRGCQ